MREPGRTWIPKISTLLLIHSEPSITFCFTVTCVPSVHLTREYRWRQRLLTMCLRPFCGHTMLFEINSYRGECAALTNDCSFRPTATSMPRRLFTNPDVINGGS